VRKTGELSKKERGRNVFRSTHPGKFPFVGKKRGGKRGPLKKGWGSTWGSTGGATSPPSKKERPKQEKEENKVMTSVGSSGGEKNNGAGRVRFEKRGEKKGRGVIRWHEVQIRNAITEGKREGARYGEHLPVKLFFL